MHFLHVVKKKPTTNWQFRVNFVHVPKRYSVPNWLQISVTEWQQKISRCCLARGVTGYYDGPFSVRQKAVKDVSKWLKNKLILKLTMGLKAFATTKQFWFLVSWLDFAGQMMQLNNCNLRLEQESLIVVWSTFQLLPLLIPSIHTWSQLEELNFTPFTSAGGAFSAKPPRDHMTKLSIFPQLL